MHTSMFLNPPRVLFVLVLSCILIAGCGDDGEEQDPNPNTSTSGETTTGTSTSSTTTGTTTSGSPECSQGTQWSAGTAIFREVTDTWFPDETWGRGQLINVADVNGDGWPDVLVRQGGSRWDDFAEGGARRTWLLVNTGQGTFEDRTEASEIRKTRRSYADLGNIGRPGAVFAFADVDNDGDLDAYSGLNTTDAVLEEGGLRETSELMLNAGDGTFYLSSQTHALRRRAAADVPSGAAFMDYDRDGWLDLWLSQNVPANSSQPSMDSLLRGTGSGDFEDVTEAAGTVTLDWELDNLNAGTAHSNAWSAAACDLNNDGTPDLLTGSYGRGPNLLWQGQRDGQGKVTYTNRSVASGFAFDHRTDWTDNESARCHCTLNPDDEDCAGVPETQWIRCDEPGDAFRWRHASDRQPFRLGGNTGAVVCADLNNDGHIDLITTEIVHWDVGSSSDPSEILFNTGEDDIRFERPGNDATGLTREYNRVDWNDGDITATAFDFDNDGWQDIYIGSTDYPDARGLLYHQTSPGQFAPVPLAEGIDHNRSHGVVVADFDRDGDLDIIVGHSRNRCSGSDDCYETTRFRAFENVLGQDGNWVQLKLEGTEGTNRSAVGARVTVTANGVTQTQEVSGGYGHYGAQNDMVLHFGLGGACEADVTIRWPNAELTTQTFKIVGQQRYQVVQGQEPAVVE